MSIPKDYVERVYAGVLGKIIGVYLGRPIEGWSFKRITAELGEISYYVHEKLGLPLVVSDDDISGTFTFIRALPDYGNRHDIAPCHIGWTWLNYLIEGRTILWWGGKGISTEHTAFLRLKDGASAPRSGSIAVNGPIIAQQIGAQIFIDSWAMVAPGDPEYAADLARRAASVSHDGEAVYGAQVIAAMESLAFVERDINKLIDTAVGLIPKDSEIYRMIEQIRQWRTEEKDWHKTRENIEKQFNQDKFPGVHIVPNHALIIMGLLYGEDNFQQTLKIVNTSGWDTDCNSGNAGCLMGIKNGLASLDSGPDWRGPVADRLFLSSAEGGRGITDAVRETYYLVNVGKSLAGEEAIIPKANAQFHFELPGSVQGFRVEKGPHCADAVEIENVVGNSKQGNRSLAVRYRNLTPEQSVRTATATFILPEDKNMIGYGLLASPTLYPGQTMKAGISADLENKEPVKVLLYTNSYGKEDELVRAYGAEAILEPGTSCELSHLVAQSDGGPIAEAGIEIRSEKQTIGAVYLDFLLWNGAPDVVFKRPAYNSTMWQRAWIQGVDHFNVYGTAASLFLSQNKGTGLLYQGTREWLDYCASATIRSYLAKSLGIAVRVQGMQRYYALIVCSDGKARLIKALEGNKVLGETDYIFRDEVLLRFQAEGPRLQAWIGDALTFDLIDDDEPLLTGAAGYVVEEGGAFSDAFTVQKIYKI